MLKSAIMFVLAGMLSPALFGADESLRGNFSVHDPSTIIKEKGQYWLFATGRGIVSRHSKDLVTWEAGPPVFTNAPAWTTNTVPGFRGTFWAPDVIRLNHQYLLYYSVSTLGSQTSAIGLATNPTLDPADPNYRWTDCGIVIQTSPRDNFNAIDPSVMLDESGQLWLVLGSFWSGIKLVQLDPKSGRRLETNSPIFALAWKEAIEASCLYRHEGYYYLFVNWDQCCRGIQSTYNIRVGRSRSVTGPYLDQSGVDLLRGGGSLLLGTEGRFIGPGHAGLLRRDGADWLSFHYYDGTNNGAATLGLRPLRWNAEGWPEVKDAGKKRQEN